MKNEVITFKVDTELREAMKGIPNRSAFIRNAVLAAVESACPVCKGTGVFTLNQRKHWGVFLKNHSLSECKDCHEIHLICHGMHTKRPKRKEKSC
jgi:hypothetical protein